MAIQLEVEIRNWPMPPTEILDLGRMAMLADPGGAIFGLWQKRRHFGAQRINEPGSWCWLELQSADPAPLLPFYEALLGWRAERIASLGVTRRMVARELDRLGPAAEVPITRGAFYFLLRLPFSGPDMPLVERLIREFKVALIPGSAFGAGPPVTLRLAYGALTPATLDEALRRLRDGLDAVLGRGG